MSARFGGKTRKSVAHQSGCQCARRLSRGTPTGARAAPRRRRALRARRQLSKAALARLDEADQFGAAEAEPEVARLPWMAMLCTHDLPPRTPGLTSSYGPFLFTLRPGSPAHIRLLTPDPRPGLVRGSVMSSDGCVVGLCAGGARDWRIGWRLTSARAGARRPAARHRPTAA